MFSRKNWLRLLPFYTQTTSRHPKSLSRSLRPQLEQLEDRCVPSTMYLVNSLADNDPGGNSTSGTLPCH